MRGGALHLDLSELHSVGWESVDKVHPERMKSAQLVEAVASPEVPEGFLEQIVAFPRPTQECPPHIEVSYLWQIH